MKILITAFVLFLFLHAEAQVKADFSATISGTCAPVVISFADSSKGNPTSWVWNFDNGDTSHAQNPQEIFSAAGTYNITLTASNSSSASSISKTIVITGSVEAGFTYQYNNVCAAPSSFSFKATDQGDTILYSWSFGNGSTGIGKATNTIFNAIGDYSVRLITTTPQGCKDTAYQSYSIGDAKAGFSSFSTVCKNAPVTFTDTSSPIPLSRSWTVDGIQAGNGSTLVHTFSANGDHTIILTDNFGTCTKTAEKTITVKDRPVAGFSESGSLQSCTVPATIQFTNSSTNADTYKWVFGDNNSNNKESPSYTYSTTGSFSPSLIAFNGDGCSDTLTKPNLVKLGPPVITSFTALPKSGCIPEAVASDANITSPDPVTTYVWNTGDKDAGNNDILVNGSHFSYTYPKENYYNVTLTVTTKNGCAGSYKLNQAVAAGTKPITDFTVDQATVCASVPVNFIDKSVGNVTSWNWNFGDNLSASGKNPSHLFTKIGSNDVTLYVSNKGCSGDPKTIKNIVTVLPPIAGFAYSYTCANQLAVQFTDGSQQPLSWLWKFGDGNTSTKQNPFYTYQSSGNYKVILKTTNGSCTSSDTMMVSVTNEKPAIVIEPAKPFICRNDSFTFSAVSSSGLISSYTWNPGDGSPAVNDSAITHVYTKSNDYKPYIAVRYVNNCKDTIYTSEPVHVYGPTAVFSASQSGNCLPLDVTFADKSTPDALHAIDTKQWYYGDGQSEEVNGVSHVYTYTKNGSFLPKMIVTDAVGCVDSVTASSPVVAKGAIASFDYSIQAACDSAVVSFANTSQTSNDAIASYSWDFDDGTNNGSTVVSPVYTYYQSGAYKVSLTVTTKSGCINRYEQKINVTISPKQNITVTAPAVACVASDFTLSASLSGNDVVSQWKWNLGNGANKSGQTITANYNKAGPYNIRTIAITSGGCSDTTYTSVTISDAPPTDAGKDSFVCAGKSIVLQATGAATYTWQQVNNELSCTACASPVATSSAARSYVVTGMNNAGCSSSDTVLIDVQQKQDVSLLTDKTSFCEGGNIQLIASGTDEYQWQPSDGLSNPFIADPVASPSVSTSYSVTGTDRRHCFTDALTTYVDVEPSPQFNIIDSAITLPRGTKHILTTTSSPDIVQWSWKPAAGLSCSNCPQPELTATTAGVYTAVASTANGCSDSDAVKVLLLCDGSGIFIPTAFTPNGDGKNDRFYAKSFADTKIISFIVVNRSGEVVYGRHNSQTNAFGDGWDGVYKGQPLPAATYIYKLEVQCEKEVLSFDGTITLIR